MCAEQIQEHQRDQHREEGVSRVMNTREPKRLIAPNEPMMPAGAIMTREQAEEMARRMRPDEGVAYLTRLD